MITLRDEEIQAVLDGSMHIDALHMSIARPSSGERYEGSGFIRSAAQGGFEFRLYDRASAPFSIEPQSIPAGRLLQPADLFDLEAQDSKGRIWRASAVQPGWSVNSRTHGALWSGRIHELVYTTDFPSETHQTTLFFLEDPALPAESWRIPMRNPKIVVSRPSQRLRVDIDARRNPLSAGFDSRIEEALWFTLGQTLWWVVKTEVAPATYSVRLRSPPRRGVSRAQVSPLESRSSAARRHLGRMFLKYYRCVSKLAEERYHPLSVNVARVLHACATGLEMEASEVCLAVESLVRRELRARMAVGARLRREVRDLSKHMKKWKSRRKRSTEVLERALSAVGAIGAPSVYSVLSALALAGRVDAEHPAAWRALRNPAMHADLSVDEARMHMIDQVRQLLILLVFHVIGYKGPFTDRSREGWPEREYPVVDA